MWELLKHIDTIGWSTPLIGLGAILVMVAWPFVQKVLPKLKTIPPTFVALVAVTAAVYFIDIETPTVATRYGDLPGSFPKPAFDWFDIDLVVKLIPSAIAI
jgi:MFS superfamily sulfate permease-like transporter